MEVILLEKVGKFGNLGDVVTVKDGFARNFLLPQKKALIANKANKEIFEKQRKILEEKNQTAKENALVHANKIENKKFVFISAASDLGVLYGSISAIDIAETISNSDLKIEKSQVVIDKPFKSLGIYDIKIMLHPEVIVLVQINIARSEEEAKLQEKGMDIFDKNASSDKKQNNSKKSAEKGDDDNPEAGQADDNIEAKQDDNDEDSSKDEAEES